MDRMTRPAALAALIAVALAAATSAAAAGETAAPNDPQAGGHAGWLLRQADLQRAQAVGGIVAPDLQGEAGGVSGEGAAPTHGGRNRVLPLAMSIVLPGLGEAYLGHVRGYPMMAIDVASWILLAHYNTQGIRKRDAYYAYAQQHWSEQQWKDSFADPLVNENAVGTYYFGYYSYADAPLWIPESADRREYFENLGKWDQFVFGWDDFEANDPYPSHPLEHKGDAAALAAPSVSPNRETYRSMRRDSNAQFTNRDRLLYFNMAMRLFSFFQVAYLEGLLGGGPKSELAVAGHPVSLIAQPAGLAGGTLGITLGY